MIIHEGSVVDGTVFKELKRRGLLMNDGTRALVPNCNVCGNQHEGPIFVTKVCVFMPI